ncbi:MAG: hypothetical protein ABH879_10655 [archaeon]
MSLRDYILDQQKKGFDLRTIRDYLISHGYQVDTVDDIISSMQERTEVRHVITLSRGVIIALILILIGSAGAGLAAYTLLTPAEQPIPATLLDIKLEPVKTRISAAEPLMFLTEIRNLGSDRRYDVLLTHTITDSSGKPALIREETVAVETTHSSQSRIDHALDPGTYRLETVASYSTQTARSSFSFTVRSASAGAEEPEQSAGGPQDTAAAPTCSDSIRNQGEAGTDCGGPCPACLTPAAHTIPGPAAPESATLESCQSKRTTIEKDICLVSLADQNNQKSICEKVQKPSQRDSCYMTLAMKGDYALCPLVANRVLKQSCTSLEQMSQVNATQQ